MPEDIFPIKLTEKSKENLCKLATYLQSLPEDYSHFGMAQWFKVRGMSEVAKWLEGKMQTCGTVACAAGHGPAAGIPVPKDLWNYDYGNCANWSEYCRREFLEVLEPGDISQQNLAMQWCFGGRWAAVDDHHYGAAARIRYLLNKGGIPESACWGLMGTETYEEFRVREQVSTPQKRSIFRKLTSKAERTCLKFLILGNKSIS